LILNYRQTETV